MRASATASLNGDSQPFTRPRGARLPFCSSRQRRERAKDEETPMTQLDAVIERDVALSTGTVDMKLEVVVIPVADVDRAKRFYGGLGWRLDGDFVVGEAFRGVQF